MVRNPQKVTKKGCNGNPLRAVSPHAETEESAVLRHLKKKQENRVCISFDEFLMRYAVYAILESEVREVSCTYVEEDYFYVY